MIDEVLIQEAAASDVGASGPVDARTLEQWVTALACDEHDLTDAQRIDQISMLESVKAACEGKQARLTVDFDASQRAERAARGIRADDQGKGVAAQVALARRVSPARGSQHVGLAKAMHEMPHGQIAMKAGVLSEHRAKLVVRQTICLSLEHRQIVDRELFADPSQLEGMGDKRLEAKAKALAFKLDPEAAIARSRKAEKDRRVTCRPAPDTMANVTALLPVAQGVAVFAALSREADALRAAGDPRTRGQIMADTLVARVTGQNADQVPSIDLRLVMTDRSLFAGDSEPAHLQGYGPVPARWAQELIAAAAGEAQVWLRRLFTSPDGDKLVAMDSRARLFTSGLRDVLYIRDQICRTPWCDAPIRHGDHPVPYEEGGETSEENGQGLCEACNYTKQVAGWRSRPVPGARHTVVVTTPTGHTYRSQAPPLPGARDLRLSRLEQHFRDLVLVA